MIADMQRHNISSDVTVVDRRGIPLGIIYESTLHTPYNTRRLGDFHRLKILPSNCFFL